MRETTLKELKKGEYFTLKPIEEPSTKQVYIREEYDRSERAYWCAKWDDCLSDGRYVKGTRKVYTDFMF